MLQPTPGGFIIPKIDAPGPTCSDKNIEACIDLSEGNPAAIGAQADALVAPEVFTPTCSLTFKPIAKGGGDHVAFGWYNIKPNNEKPTQAELYGMFILAIGNTQGATLTAMFPPLQLNLAAEEAAGRYKGGAIGFWLAGDGDFSKLTLDPVTHAIGGTPATLNRVFYTQHALNPGSQLNSTFYQVLTWQSVTFKNSFYFGWEDRVASADADNDFDDLVFLVSGIQCAGGGEACDTGKMGVCKDGTMQCQKGELTCVQSVQPSAETCNALDDDCMNGVDDGDLCETGFICDRGRCVPKCSTGEFRCQLDEDCTAKGVCVEKLCSKKDCPAGQVCHKGECVDSCKGVLCPHGTVCRNGGCADPCTGVMCDDGFTCVLGVCQSCECSDCGAGLVCGTANVCVATGCESQTCAAGTHCAAGGTCVDDCAGAVCPQGQICQAGDCVADPNAKMNNGGSGGTGSDDPKLPINPGVHNAGTFNGTGGDGMGGSAAKPDPGPMLSSGQGDADGKSGCACSVPGKSGDLRVLAGLALVAGLLLRRRR